MKRELLIRRYAELESLVLTAVLLPVVKIAVTRFPLPKIRADLAAWLPPRPGPPRLAAARTGRLVAAASRRVPWSGACLERALIAEALLRREGYAARLVIGVQRPDSKLSAHAWVESQGQVVIGAARDLDRFVPLATGMESTSLRSFRTPT